MTKIYTAIGRFERRSGNDGQYPIVIVNKKEHIMDIAEMIIWTCCNWRFLEFSRIGELYAQMSCEAGIDNSGDLPQYINRLLQRGLIVEGIGGNSADALYDLISNLYIIPISSGFFVKALAFLKFIFVNKMPFSKAKTVFRKETLQHDEKRIIDLARQTALSTAELIKCIEAGVYDLSCDTRVMDAIYNDRYTTSDNISYYAKQSVKQRIVLETVANLYLRKQIIFERI